MGHDIVLYVFRNTGPAKIWWNIFDVYSAMGPSLGGQRGVAHWWARRNGAVVNYLRTARFNTECSHQPAVRKSKHSLGRHPSVASSAQQNMEAPSMTTEALLCTVARWGGCARVNGGFSEVEDIVKAREFLERLLAPVQACEVQLRIDSSSLCKGGRVLGKHPCVAHVVNGFVNVDALKRAVHACTAGRDGALVEAWCDSLIDRYGHPGVETSVSLSTFLLYLITQKSLVWYTTRCFPRAHAGRLLRRH